MYHCTDAVRFGCHVRCSVHWAKFLNRKLSDGELHFEVRSVFSARLMIQTVRSREEKSGEMEACSIAVHMLSVCSVINFIHEVYFYVHLVTNIYGAKSSSSY